MTAVAEQVPLIKSYNIQEHRAGKDRIGFNVGLTGDFEA